MSTKVSSTPVVAVSVSDLSNEIMTSFHNELKSLVKLLQAKVKGNEKYSINLDHVDRLLRLAPSDLLFQKSMDQIWDAREAILNRDDDYILSYDPKRILDRIKQETKDDDMSDDELGDDSSNEIIDASVLINNVKDIFPMFNKAEKAVVWSKIISLVTCIAKYKKVHE